MSVDFSTIKDAAMLVLMFVVFGAPALAIAARLAIKPVLEAIVKVRDISAPAQPPDDPRIAALESYVNRLQLEVQRLSEAEAFTRQLTRGPNHP